MQSLISANQKSETEKKMNLMGSYIPMYNIKKSMAPLGIQFHQITPYISIPGTVTNIDSKSITFQETSGSGFLYNSSYALQATMTVVTADIAENADVGVTFEPYFAFNVLRSLEVFSKGNLIIYKTGEALFCQACKIKDVAYQTFILNKAKMLVATTEAPREAGAGIVWTYLEDIQSYLDAPEKMLLTNVIGDLQIRLTFNGKARAGTTNEVTALTAYKYSSTYTPELSVLNKQILNDWSAPLTMQMVNTDTEQVPLTTTTTVSNYAFTTPYLVNKTHIMIKQIATETNHFGCQLYPIYTINSLNIGGVPLFTNIPVSRVKSNSFRRGNCNFNLTNAGALTIENGVLTIDWSVLCDPTQNTGTAFFQQLRGSTISITFATVPTIGNANMFVCHEYFQLVDYIPNGTQGGSNGYLMVSENR